ncbi:MAG: murein biosynthesis integral membrane protein MurJ [Patescibacteria group bacterium]|jgi:putative peptidoglycan lipid II flippase
MWQRIWNRINTTVTGGAIVIAAASVLSRLLGLVRDRLLASSFGAGDVLDSYYAAFKLPDLIFNILVLGALSSAFIPVFIRYISQRKENETMQSAWEMASAVLNILLIGLIAVGILCFIFADYLMPLIAPGFTGEKREITIHLTRIMLVAIVFFGASNIATGILTSFKKYLNFAFAPVMYNLGIIFGILVLVPRMGIYGLGYGVVIGAVAHLLVQLPSIMKLGFRYRPVLSLKHPGVREVGKLMLPRAFGLAVSQVEQLMSTIIGSTLAAGSVAVFSLANNLQSFPINVVGVSLAVATFPIFSEAFARNDVGHFVSHFSKAFRRILFLIIPTSVLILLLRAQIVRVVLGSGNFSWQDTYLTAQTIGFFSLSLFAQSLIPMLARSFYALHDTKTPVKVGIVSVAINVGVALAITPMLGVVGLGISFSLASVVNMMALLLILRRRVGYLDDHQIAWSTVKVLLISAIMGAIIIGMKYFLALGVDMSTFVGIFIQGVGAGLVGIVSYIILAIMFRCDEISLITRWVQRMRAQFFSSPSSNG